MMILRLTLFIAFWVAAIALRAHKRVAGFVIMFISQFIRIAVLMAIYTAKCGSTTRCVAIGTFVPFALVFARVNRENRIVIG